MTSFTFEVLPLFAQADASTEQDSFDFLNANFGLLPVEQSSSSSPTRTATTDWERLAAHIAESNSTTEPNVCYKVIFLARHGQGFHNLAELKYGTDEWDDHYSKLDGADGLHWFDARLTELGQEQARSAAQSWASLSRLQKMPVPQSFYCSPLIRCLQTARITHAGPERGRVGGDRYTPVIKEQLRETNGVHTCDKRSPRSAITVRFPEAVFEEAFAESDELWSADEREAPEDQDVRLRECLNEMFATDDSEWISVTTHSGASRAIMKALNYPREWRLQPGEIVPIAVKATREHGRD